MLDNKIKAVGYCRFSSDHQKELSIEAQQRAIQKYADNNGYEIVEWYIDRAVSGQTTNRPDFQKMCRKIESKDCDFVAVIVHKLDRFSRNVVDTFQFQQFFADNSIELVSVEENFNGDDFILGLNALLNQRYVQNLSKEVMKGMKERAYKSLFNGGVAPLGYKIVDGKYEIDEAEAIIVRDIFQMAADGYGYNTIIQELNRKGYRTRKGNTFGKNSCYDLLRNPRYKGEYIYNQTVKRNSKRKRNMRKHKDENEIIRIPNAIPAIVSPELWERANASRRLTAKTSTNAKFPYLLSGLVYCGECGCKMHGNHRKYGEGGYNTYKCNKQANKLTCDSREIRADVLEEFVIDNLVKFFFGEGVVEQITKQINEKIKETLSADSESVTLAKNALQGLKMARGNLIDSMAKIGYNEALSERLTTIEKQIAENEALIVAEESQKTELTVTEAQVKEKIAELKKALQNPQHIDKTKLLLREYIERITVYNKKIELTVKVSFFFTLDDGNLVDFDYNHTIFEDRLLIENSRDRMSNNSRKSLVHRNLLVFGGVGVDTEKRRTPDIYTVGSSVVPVAGLEPARCRQRWILSPLRLPIPSHRHWCERYYTTPFK